MEALFAAAAAMKAANIPSEAVHLRIVSRTLDMHRNETACDTVDTPGRIALHDGLVCLSWRIQYEEERVNGTTCLVLAPGRMNALIDREGQFCMTMPIQRRLRNAVDYHTPFGLIKAYTTGLSAEAALSDLHGTARLAYLLEFENFKEIMTVEVAVSPAIGPA